MLWKNQGNALSVKKQTLSIRMLCVKGAFVQDLRSRAQVALNQQVKCKLPQLVSSMKNRWKKPCFPDSQS